MKLQIIKARLHAMKEALNQQSQKGEADHISWTLASDFNTILLDISKQFDETEGLLPTSIPQEEHFPQIGQATFLDLDIKINQLIKILEVLESGQ